MNVVEGLRKIDFQHAFWIILEHSACILEHSVYIQQLFGCVFKLGDGQTDGQTDIRTCRAASSQLKNKM